MGLSVALGIICGSREGDVIMGRLLIIATDNNLKNKNKKTKKKSAWV